MAAEHELTPGSYIGHHLAFREVRVAEGPFWVLNIDTVLTSVGLGIIGIGFLWWVVRGATAGVPNTRQALVEVLCDFVDRQAKDIFHGDRRFIAPTALTVGLWVLLPGAVDDGRRRRRRRHLRHPARCDLGALPHPDRAAAGLHLHDADHRVHLDGARKPLIN